MINSELVKKYFPYVKVEDLTEHSLEVIAAKGFEENKELFNMAKSTTEAYARDIKQFVKYLGEKNVINDVCKISISHVKGFLSSSKVNNNTRHRKKNALSAAVFKEAINAGFIISNPCSAIKLPPKSKNQRRAYITNYGMLNKFLFADISVKGYSKYLIYVLRLVFLVTGSRISKIRLLRWKHIDLKNKNIYIYDDKNTNKKNTKNGLDRIIPIPNQLAAALESIQNENPDAFVFSQQNGRPIGKVACRECISRAAEIAEIELEGEENLTSHCFRHNISSHLNDLGANFVQIAEFLGHKNAFDFNFEVTSNYVHSNKDKLRQYIQKYTDLIFAAKGYDDEEIFSWETKVKEEENEFGESQDSSKDCGYWDDLDADEIFGWETKVKEEENEFGESQDSSEDCGYWDDLDADEIFGWETKAEEEENEFGESQDSSEDWGEWDDLDDDEIFGSETKVEEEKNNLGQFKVEDKNLENIIESLLSEKIEKVISNTIEVLIKEKFEQKFNTKVS